MNKVQKNNPLPLTVRIALDKIDDIETVIAASIDRFVHTSGARLSSAIEPSPGQQRAAHDRSLPYPENGPVAR